MAGVALCNVCHNVLKYGAGGKSVLLRHANKAEHKKPSTYQLHTSSDQASEASCSLPYGAAPNIHSDAQCSQRVEPQLVKIPSFQDRVAHTEAFVVSYMAENNLPFTMAPKLLEFAKFMSRDPKVLAKISMSRETAAYKLKDGLAPIIKEKIVESIECSYLSMNVDNASLTII